jgi:hypothetical protein
LKHVRIEGEKVKLQTIKKRGDLTISHSRLVCKQIDYSADKELLVATGPGNIEVNNANAEPDKTESDDAEADKAEPGRKPDMGGKCYARIEGFDLLEYSAAKGEMRASGKKNSLLMGYWPIVDGELGKRVLASTSVVRANFADRVDGGSDLVKLIMTGGISYEEEDGHLMVGDNLSYDAKASTMKIKGNEATDVFVDSILVPEVIYNLDTGDLNTGLSTTPGSVGF